MSCNIHFFLFVLIGFDMISTYIHIYVYIWKAATFPFDHIALTVIIFATYRLRLVNNVWQWYRKYPLDPQRSVGSLTTSLSLNCVERRWVSVGRWKHESGAASREEWKGQFSNCINKCNISTGWASAVMQMSYFEPNTHDEWTSKHMLQFSEREKLLHHHQTSFCFFEMCPLWLSCRKSLCRSAAAASKHAAQALCNCSLYGQEQWSRVIFYNLKPS